MKLKLIWMLLLLGAITWSCQKTELPPEHYSIQFDLPAHFPQPPIDDPEKMTVKKINLGKKLFFDPLLSIDSTVSCGTCHKPEHGFADLTPGSVGVGGTTPRNSPTLVNIAYNRLFHWDGGLLFMEEQVFAPLTSEEEMGMTFAELVIRLKKNDAYVMLFEDAFGKGAPINARTINEAITAYERTIISAWSPYDYYLEGDANAMTASQKRGEALFFSDSLACGQCHSGFNFTDQQFHNNGLYLQYADTGRARVTGRASDVGKFKVPTLRNVALTAPYMHDGSLPSLEAVADHYISGGKGHPNQDPRIRPHTLTSTQRQDLINFLHSLTDTRPVLGF